MSFSIVHTNVDGAGHAGNYATKQQAIDAANALQAAADSRGNSSCYTYHVFHNSYGSPKVYETECMVRCTDTRYINLADSVYMVEEYLLYGADGRPKESFCRVQGKRFATMAEAEDWVNATVAQAISA